MATKKNLNEVAAAETAKIFTNKKSTQSKKKNTAVEDHVNAKTEKKVFSFRGEEDHVKAWRLYATVTGTKVDELGSLAMEEYLANHPLKGAEKALFDEKMK